MKNQKRGNKETKKGFQGGSGHLLKATDGPDEELK